MFEAPERISLSCDGCNAWVNVEDVTWLDASAFCPKCCEGRDEIPVEERKQAFYYPLYFMYSNSILLHITQDLKSPNAWKSFQGSNWFMWSVSNVVVKHFDTKEQVDFAEKRLIQKLAPRYGDEPNPIDDLDGEENPTIYSVDTEADKKSLQRILNVRMNEEMYSLLTQAAVVEGSDRPTWVRSVLYQAIRQALPEA